MPLLHKVCAFRCLRKASNLRSFSGSDILKRNLPLFQKLRYFSEGAVSHNVLYYQQLSIALYQVSFDAK